jgi:hypothetical protein
MGVKDGRKDNMKHRLIDMRKRLPRGASSGDRHFELNPTRQHRGKIFTGRKFGYI